MWRGHLALVHFHRQDAGGTQGRDGLATGMLVGRKAGTASPLECWRDARLGRPRHWDAGGTQGRDGLATGMPVGRKAGTALP